MLFAVPDVCTHIAYPVLNEGEIPDSLANSLCSFIAPILDAPCRF